MVVANVISLIVRFKWNISSNFVSSINYFRSVGGSNSSIIGPILTSISNQPNVRNDLCMCTHITYNEQENSKSASDCSHYAMQNKSEKHHHRPYIAFEAFFRLVFLIQFHIYLCSTRYISFVCSFICAVTAAAAALFRINKAKCTHKPFDCVFFLANSFRHFHE